MKIIDLSHPLQNGTPVYPGDPEVSLASHAQLHPHGYHLTRMSLGTHTGTHIDAPSHILEKGRNLDDYPLSHFTGKGKLIDCTHARQITPEYFVDLWDQGAPEFLLFHTGNDKAWGGPTYFSNFPILTEEASELLAGMPLKGMGIDAPSFDPPDSSSYRLHSLFLGRDILLIENLCGLELLKGCDFTFFCFPLRIVKADGSPIRACAILEDQK